MLPINNLNAIAAAEIDHLEEIREQNIHRRNLRDASDPFQLNETYFINLINY